MKFAIGFMVFLIFWVITGASMESMGIQNNSIYMLAGGIWGGLWTTYLEIIGE